MTHIVSKRIKGNVYWYEVRSERKGSRVQQVHVKYLGRDGTKGKPSVGALRNLGKQELETIRKTDPEYAAAWDQADGQLLFGQVVWKRRVALGKIDKPYRKEIRRLERNLARLQKAIRDPMDLQRAQDTLIKQAEAEHDRYVQMLRGLRSGKTSLTIGEYNRLLDSWLDASGNTAVAGMDRDGKIVDQAAYNEAR